jgi:hypothetical protein
MQKRVPAPELVPLDAVRTRLATTWLGGSAIVVILVVIQSLLGKYGEKTQDAWGWLLPTIMPTLGMVVSVLGYAALDPVMSRFDVRKSFFQIALWLSAFYLLLILLTILIQPFTGTDPIALMHTSNLWLGPCQGLVGSALGVLFASKTQKGEDKTS